MDFETARVMSLEELQNIYRSFLQSCNLEKTTIQTASTDTFYLWRNESADEFWRVIISNDFEKDARRALINALRHHSKGNPDILVNGYMSHLRKFRKYILSDENLAVASKLQTIRQTKKSAVDVPAPSAEQIEHYLQQWDELENYHLQEDALDKLFFNLCPQNTDISDILVKVATLNDFYSTNIFSVYPVAKHILELDIDNRLKAGDVSLVRDIQQVIINGTEKNFYSFSTKYCSHHNPLDFPIYDSYVEKVLFYFRDKDAFYDFANSDLKDYIKFKNILLAFRKFYGLEQYNLKLIDKYLWQLGKEYFPNNYGKR